MPIEIPAAPVGAKNPANSSTIAIAMCTYNGERFLKEQLESFVNQSRLPDHLVVCDDASTDATQRILKEFADQSPFPVELHFNTATLGVPRNFEQALLACTGDYIALCDQDDRWHSSKLERLSELLDVNPQAGFACSDAELIDKNGNSLHRKLWNVWRTDPATLALKPPNQRRAYSVRSNCVTGATMMLRRKVVWDCLAPIPQSWVHDHWLAVLCEILNRPGCATPELLTQYRLHPGQTIGVGTRNWFRRLQTTDERQKKCMQRQQRYDDLQAHLEAFILPLVPEAAIWHDVIHSARQDLAVRQKELRLPWWHRGFNRILRGKRRAA